MNLVEFKPSQSLLALSSTYKANMDAFTKMIAAAEKVKQGAVKFNIDPKDDSGAENITKFLAWLSTLATKEEWAQGVEIPVSELGLYAGRSNSKSPWAVACRSALVKDSRTKASCNKYRLSGPHIRGLMLAVTLNQAHRCMHKMSVMHAEEKHLMALSELDSGFDIEADVQMDFDFTNQLALK